MEDNAELYHIIDESVTFRYFNGGWRNPYSQHQTGWRNPPFLVIVYVEKGSYYYEMKDRGRVYIGEGRAMLIPAGIVHLVGLDGEGILNFAHVQYTFASHLDLLDLFRIPPVTDIEHGGIIADIADELARVHYGGTNDFKAIAASKMLGFKLLLAILNVSAPRETGAVDFIRLKRISGVLDYMQEHLSEPVSRKKLADLLSVSENRLHCVFKEALGLSPIRHMRNIRIKHAQDLLITTIRPISEIAAETGYKDLYHFSKSFKEQTGVSPLNYRRKHALADIYAPDGRSKR